MTKFFRVFIIVLILAFPGISQAGDRMLTEAEEWFSKVKPEMTMEEIRQKFKDEELEFKEGQGLAYNLSNTKSKEERFQLFLKSGQSENTMYDITDDGLNRVEPAAGVKFTMPIEF